MLLTKKNFQGFFFYSFSYAKQTYFGVIFLLPFKAIVDFWMFLLANSISGAILS